MHRTLDNKHSLLTLGLDLVHDGIRRSLIEVVHDPAAASPSVTDWNLSSGSYNT